MNIYEKYYHDIQNSLSFEDMLWIDKHLFIHEHISNSWVERAKKLRGKRDNIAGGNLVESGSQRWFSVLAEYWVGYYFESLTDRNKGDWRSKHDFLHKSGKTFDVKTNAGVTKFIDLAGMSYFYDQPSMFKGYDGFIFSYYDLRMHIVSLIGWLTTPEFMMSRVVKRGKRLSFGGGRGFITTADTRLVPWNMMYPLSLLEVYDGVQLPDSRFKIGT